MTIETSSSKKRVYLSLSMKTWDKALQVDPSSEPQVKIDFIIKAKSIGFLEVYESLEKMEEELGRGCPWTPILIDDPQEE
jgi:hypothetical protein